MDRLENLLNYLEEKIDIDHIKHVEDTQTKILQYEPVDSICMNVTYPTGLKYYEMDETHEDMAKMMYNELIACVPIIESKSYGLPMIRANYGVGTLPSLFGVNSRIVNGNMPWVDHVSEDKVREIIAKGVPDLDSGFGKKLRLTHEFYRETLARYPKCQEAIKIYHPDFQGPFDVAHLIFGPDIYLAMYDDGELIHELLSLVTETYLKLMKRTKTEINDQCGENCYQWSFLYGGKAVIRDDSPVNLSCDMYKEFAKHYDDKIIDALGGASIHFCGRADQWIFEMGSSKNLKGLNFGYMEKLGFGQEYLDYIMPALRKNNVPVMGYTLSKKDFDTFDFSKYSTGISYVMSAANKDEAEEILQQVRGRF